MAIALKTTIVLLELSMEEAQEVYRVVDLYGGMDADDVLAALESVGVSALDGDTSSPAYETAVDAGDENDFTDYEY